MLASKKNGTLYIGVTSDLVRRVYEHKTGVMRGVTHKYHVHMLVWFEHHEDIVEAIGREKKLKKYNRKEKIALIEIMNPEWKDLYNELL